MRLNPPSAIRSHLRRLTIALLACGLAWAAPPARASFPGANGKILFARFFSYPVGFQWFTINPDGSGETVLPGESSGMAWFTGSAEWSADGSRIAFVAGEQGNVYTMNADGTGVVNVTNLFSTRNAKAVTWAPNGTQLAYTQSASGVGDGGIWTINADGTDPTQITTLDEDNAPAWSPDGGTIAFIRQSTEDDFAIWLMNPDGSGQSALPNGAITAGFASIGWSPDGTKLVFIDAGSGGLFEIFVINPDGTGRTQLTNFAPGRYVNSRPQWSPDGTKIAFALSTQTFPSGNAHHPVDK